MARSTHWRYTNRLTGPFGFSGRDDRHDPRRFVLPGAEDNLPEGSLARRDQVWRLPRTSRRPALKRRTRIHSVLGDRQLLATHHVRRPVPGVSGYRLQPRHFIAGVPENHRHRVPGQRWKTVVKFTHHYGPMVT